MGTRFKVEIANSWQAVERRWIGLQREGVCTPFQNANWLSAWYDAFGQSPDIEPVLAAVTEVQSGKDVLLIPLVRRRVGQLRMIEFADLWTADYNAPVIGPGAPSSEADCHALWNELLSAVPRADIVRFTKMPYTVRGRPNPLCRLQGTRPSNVRGHVINLPETWEDYLASLKKDMKKALRRRWRRFQEHDNARLLWIEDAVSARRVLRVLVEQQLSRLEYLGARHVFNGANHIHFYERYVTDGVANGSAILSALLIQDTIVATFLAVADGHCCILIRSSQMWDDGYASLGLSKLIIERSMELLHQRGYRCFDLSIGDADYKDDFGVTPVPLYEYQMVRTWRALPTFYGERTVAALKKSPHLLKLVRSAKRLGLPKVRVGARDRFVVPDL